MAKRHEVSGFLPWMIAKIRARLHVENFDEVARFAITHDMAPLRLFCAKFAEQEGGVRALYEAEKLSPEVCPFVSASRMSRRA